MHGRQGRQLSALFDWCRLRDLNPRPSVYKTTDFLRQAAGDQPQSLISHLGLGEAMPYCAPWTLNLIPLRTRSTGSSTATRWRSVGLSWRTSSLMSLTPQGSPHFLLLDASE